MGKLIKALGSYMATTENCLLLSPYLAGLALDDALDEAKETCTCSTVESARLARVGDS